MVHALPVGHHNVHHHGHSYHYHSGYYYRRVYHGGDVVYVGIYPPVGIVIRHLPTGYYRYDDDDDVYYVYNNVYYKAGTKSGETTYIVVDPPGQEAAKENDPHRRLQEMSDFLGQLKGFQVEVEESVDGQLASGAKVQLSTKRVMLISRPKGFRSVAKGQIADRAVWYDGSKLTVLDRRKKVYASVKAPDSIDKTIDFAVKEYGVALPLMDLMYSNSYQALLVGTDSGVYLGKSNVGGTACHHLAFKGEAADWQIWVDAGDVPLPRKLVIINKLLDDQPRYTAVLKNWDISPDVRDGQFRFPPPSDAEEIELLPLNTY
jgi:hypothetical protein